MQCIPCGNYFSGEAPYQQHMASAKHKKKVMVYNMLNGSTSSSSMSPAGPSSIATDSIPCNVCHMSFNSLQTYQAHCQTREHAEKVISSSDGDNVSFEDVSDSGSVNTESTVEEKSMSENDVIIPGLEARPSTFPADMTSFYCTPCKKPCSGYENYIAHLKGKYHMKVEQRLKFAKFYGIGSNSSEGGTAPPELQGKLYFCAICNVQSSGPIPYQDHLKGANHLKNERRSLQASLGNSVQPSMQQNINGNSSSSNGSDVSQLVNGTEHPSNKPDLTASYIIPEFKKSLETVTVEEVLESMTVIQQDEPISFDKPKDEPGLKDIENGVSNDVSEDIMDEEVVNGIDQKPRVCKACELCNVQLFSEEEVANHYESREHYQKKWGSSD